MQRGEDVRRERALDELAALQRHLEVLADHGFGGGGAQRDDDMRLDAGDLALEPLVAGVDLALRRGLVQAPLAARLPLEVLHRVGDVEVIALYARGLQRTVEQASRRPDERQPLLVLLVAR